MCKLKRLAFTTARKIYDFVRPGARIRRRIKKLTPQSPKVEGLVRRMESHIRELRADALIEEIEDKLKNTTDPKERMALHASIDTVKFLAEKGADIPDTLKEFVQLQVDLIVIIHRIRMQRLKRFS